MDERQIGLFLLNLPIFLLSVIVHECSHGLVALWRGDPTAKYAGRLTLNPIPHIDLYGSIILPGILLLNRSGFVIGWAKPVPIDVRNLRHRNDALLVAAAGPVSNLLLAYVFALAFSVAYRLAHGMAGPLLLITVRAVTLNCLLAIFNLLPIPPLDGHWLALRFLPPSAARAYARIGFFGILIIFLLLLIPGVSETLVQRPMLTLAEFLFRAAGVPPAAFS